MSMEDQLRRQDFRIAGMDAGFHATPFFPARITFILWPDGILVRDRTNNDANTPKSDRGLRNFPAVRCDLRDGLERSRQIDIAVQGARPQLRLPRRSN
jgi:hypothetical protein